MTAADLLRLLLEARATVQLTPEGDVYCKAPKGVLTPALIEMMRAVKADLCLLLSEAPSVVRPAVDSPEASSDYRVWVTGRIPPSSMMTVPLPEPTYHDLPTPPRTALDAPCTVKTCAPTHVLTNGDPASLYYEPSHTCVQCYARWEKHTHEKGDAHDDDQQAPLFPLE